MRDASVLFERLEIACRELGVPLVVRDREAAARRLVTACQAELERLVAIRWRERDAASLAEYLAARLATAHEGPLDEALAALPMRDLLIAWACTDGIEGGAAAFEAELGPIVRATALRVAGAAADDVVQGVYERVLVRGTDGVIGIAGYSGQGPLAVWAQVVTSRLAFNRVRDESRRREDALEDDALSLRAADVELELVRATYRPAFKSAIEQALAELTPRDRNLLRYTLVDGLGLDAIGRIHGVHRATVARWIAATRETLHARTREILRDALRIDESEIDSIVPKVRSQVDVSLLRILGSD